jgi:hypothetical protein
MGQRPFGSWSDALEFAQEVLAAITVVWRHPLDHRLAGARRLDGQEVSWLQGLRP